MLEVAEFEAHAASLQAQLQERHNQEFAEARKKVGDLNAMAFHHAFELDLR